MNATSTRYDYARPRRSRAELERGSDLSRAAAPALVAAARRIAGGDEQLLWVDDAGDVWVLNHPRDQRCHAAACPACPSSPSRPHGRGRA